MSRSDPLESNSDRTLRFHRKQALMAIQIYVILLSVCLLIGAGSLLVPLFPLSSVILALYLYFHAPDLYIGFSLWLIFLGSVIRRIIDYQSGYLTFGPWTLTSQLVICISAITFFLQLPRALKGNSIPLLFPLISIFFSLLIGLLNTTVRSVVVTSFGWISPLFFSFHLYLNWRSYPKIRKVFEQVFLWGTLVMGSYGVFQYVIAPEWDKFFLRNITANSFGSPEPFGIRVFSTMDSPQSFAGTIVVGLLLMLNQAGTIRFIASPIGYLAFLLSAARTAWLSYLIGLLTLLPTSKLLIQMRLISSFLILLLLSLPLLSMDPFSTVILNRIETFQNFKQDTSFNARTEGYEELWSTAIRQVTGVGIGVGFESDSLGSNDSGIFTLLFTLGWIGLIPYALGLAMLLIQAFSVPTKFIDPFMGTTRIIALAGLSRIGLSVAITGDSGIWIWSFLTLSIIGYKYHLYLKFG